MAMTIGGKTPQSIEIGGKAVQSLAIGGEVVWSEAPEYFYIKNEYNVVNTITIEKHGAPSTGTTLEYSTDGSTWSTPVYDASGKFGIALQNQNDKVYFRSSDGLSQSDTKYYRFTETEIASVGGDIRTLLDYTDRTLSSASARCFFSMLSGGKITDASNLDMSGITTLSTGCFRSMFGGNSLLTAAPQSLLATVGASSAYDNMFYNCTSITETPEIHTVPNGMDSFSFMFSGCSNLNKVYLYAAGWDSSKADYWLDGVSATGDFYNLGGATIPTGTNGIPSGWTEHTSL